MVNMYYGICKSLAAVDVRGSRDQKKDCKWSISKSEIFPSLLNCFLYFKESYWVVLAELQHVESIPQLQMCSSAKLLRFEKVSTSCGAWDIFTLEEWFCHNTAQHLNLPWNVRRFHWAQTPTVSVPAMSCLIRRPTGIGGHKFPQRATWREILLNWPKPTESSIFCQSKQQLRKFFYGKYSHNFLKR